ncbi:GAF domain-containing protein [Arthrobacter sp. CP30]
MADDELARLIVGQDAVLRQDTPAHPPVLRAPYDHEPAGQRLQDTNKPKAALLATGLSRPGSTWPALQTRLSSMFDPAEAENRRLASLRSTGLFDSAPEERFDRITRQAQQRFAVNSATISFIGRDRQVIKSATGPLGGDMPRHTSFCSHTIADDTILVIPDASEDSRFADNDLVRGSAHIRFYAGHPLTGPGGWRIGALCILDTEPRGFNDQDAQDFRALASLTQLQIYRP